MRDYPLTIWGATGRCIVRESVRLPGGDKARGPAWSCDLGYGSGTPGIAYKDPYALPMTNLSSGSAGQNLARRYVIFITKCFERAVTWTVAVQSVAVLAKHWWRNTSRCSCKSERNPYYSECWVIC